MAGNNTSPARNEFEAEENRTFIAGLMVKSGKDVSGVEVWKLLNDHRMTNVRDAATKAGKPADEVERLALAARITVQSVRRDMRILIGRAQEAGAAGAAVFLDDQIAAVRDEIESTHLMDEQIAGDLERSRETRWSRTLGEFRKSVEGTVGGGIEATEVVRFVREEGAASSALYARLQANMRERAKLRAELRTLQFGRQNVREPEEEDAEVRSFAEAVTDLTDPANARAACLNQLRAELRSLTKASNAPLAGDMQRMEQLRLKNTLARVQGLVQLVRLPVGDEGEGGGAFLQVFERAEPRRIGAGAASAEEVAESSPGD